MNNLKAEFSKLATDGCLGDPLGRDAYAYLRASSERQVEEGSSFPRQLESVYQAAIRDGLRISFELIFFDDGYSGFEFEHRPALLKLRHEIHSQSRAEHLVIEDIDRLSRHSDWHQGFLLDELTQRGMQVHFFKHPGSQLERTVRGVIAQEAMQKDLERMRMGSIFKAMDGRVTAKRPRYGYSITDPQDSYYELHPEESSVMRRVYERLVYDGWTLYRIADEMNERGIPTRFRTGFWTPSTLYQLVKSPVYKGEFYAQRHYQVKTGEFSEDGKPKKTTRVRPEDEWIKVEVPAIVTPEEWQQAQDSLTRNAKRSMRNSRKRSWLLSGFLKCAICRDYSFVAIVGNTKRSPRRYHGCNSRGSQKARKLRTACYSPYVRAEELERGVWEQIEQVIYDPTLLVKRLEQRENEERLARAQAELERIRVRLSDIEKAKAKFEAAYERDIYTLDEFEEKMKDLRRESQALDIQSERALQQIEQAHTLEEQKEVLLSGLEHIRIRIDEARIAGRQSNELPFALKRRVLELLVDVIWVNSVERTFTIEGVVRGTFGLAEPQGDLIAIPLALPLTADLAFVSSRKWR